MPLDRMEKNGPSWSGRKITSLQKMSHSRKYLEITLCENKKKFTSHTPQKFRSGKLVSCHQLDQRLDHTPVSGFCAIVMPINHVIEESFKVRRSSLGNAEKNCRKKKHCGLEMTESAWVICCKWPRACPVLQGWQDTCCKQTTDLSFY